MKPIKTGILPYYLDERVETVTREIEELIISWVEAKCGGWGLFPEP